MTNKQTYRWTESSIFFAFQKHLNTQEVGGGVSYKFLYKNESYLHFKLILDSKALETGENFLGGKSQKCSKNPAKKL